MLTKQKSPQIWYYVSPTSSSSDLAAASRQTKTLNHNKSAAFLNKRNVTVCHRYVSALNALEDLRVDEPFLLKMKSISAKNG